MPSLARRSLLLCLALLVAPASAPADPTAPVLLEPTDDALGPIFDVGFRTLDDLPFPYVQEEYLVSGSATIYTYAQPPVRGEPLALVPDVPYTTRIIVRRPASHGVFKGTVVIEWWNSTAGFDTAPAWDSSAEFFGREGIAYVGVTNSTTSLDFLKGGCSLFGVLPPMCGTRYASLEMSENGQAWDMLSQIANLLKSDSPENPFPEKFEVERIYHVGQSQQGGSVVTYANDFHFPVNDGYFIHTAGRARPINFLPDCASAGAPPYPDCTPRLEGEQSLVRRDLPVPVYRAMSETDLAELGAIGARQEDSGNFRYYEMAGVAHSSVHKDVEVPVLGILLEDFCRFQMNTMADGPVVGGYLLDAMWSNMEAQVKRGTPPPHGELIEVVGDEIQRDAFGNARGGIRLPAVQVPVATYLPSNEADPSLPPFLIPIANLACFLSGSVLPFDQATLDELYPNHGSYVSAVTREANELVRQRFLLHRDAAAIKLEAARSGIGCGIGFELVLVLPPLAWLRRRRRRASIAQVAGHAPADEPSAAAAPGQRM